MTDRTITPEMARLIKGMLARGDDQSDIAACFLVNGGRVSEINTEKRFADARAAAFDDLPPAPPYPSFYELWRAQRGLWAARVALKAVAERIDQALTAIEKAEARIDSK